MHVQENDQDCKRPKYKTQWNKGWEVGEDKQLKSEIPRFNLDNTYEFLYGVYEIQVEHHQRMKKSKTTL